MLDITLLLKSRFTVEIRGERPERFLNAAAAKGIYISGARPVKDGLRLSLSRHACMIMEEELPPGLVMERVREHGLPRFLRRLKGRYLLPVGGVLAAAVLFAFSRFVWRVELSGGTPELRAQVAEFLEEKNLRVGTLKSSISQNDIKREAILAMDDLMWLWVDLKGTTAYVRLAERTLPPQHLTNEPANVVAKETGVVEQIVTTEGQPMVAEGQTVERGSILISGAVESERIETMIRHARGSVIARVWRDKSVTIPKTTEIRRRTGSVQKIKSIKIKKFTINFTINSSILYPKYDRIRTKYKLGSIPLEFIADEYAEVEAETSQVDLEEAKALARAAFEQEIADSGAELVKLEVSETDSGDVINLFMRAECLTDIAVEMPM